LREKVCKLLFDFEQLFLIYNCLWTVYNITWMGTSDLLSMLMMHNISDFIYKYA